MAADRESSIAARQAKYEAKRAELRAKLDATKAANRTEKEQHAAQRAAREPEIRAQIDALGETDTFGTKKEIKYLPDVMDPDDETIMAITSGFMDGNTWLVVCTNRRILFIDKGLIFGLKQVDIPMDSISSVVQKTGMMFGSVEILGAGLSGMKVTNILKSHVGKFAKAVQAARLEFKP